MKKINILYIDDQIDPFLSKYLDDYCNNTNLLTIEVHEKQFTLENTYEELLSSIEVRNANIIIIDSVLFENNNVHNSKFTGEEFKIILKKYFPFIEVIVITQNECPKGLDILKKYTFSNEKSYTEFYNDKFKTLLEASIQNIGVYRTLADNLMKNDNIESVLKEKIRNSINGINVYDELTKSDIDNLIEAFKKIKD